VKEVGILRKNHPSKFKNKNKKEIILLNEVKQEKSEEKL
jgi:hypothetical protein